MLHRLLPGSMLSLDDQCKRDRGTNACFVSVTPTPQLGDLNSRGGTARRFSRCASPESCRHHRSSRTTIELSRRRCRRARAQGWPRARAPRRPRVAEIKPVETRRRRPSRRLAYTRAPNYTARPSRAPKRVLQRRPTRERAGRRQLEMINCYHLRANYPTHPLG